MRSLGKITDQLEKLMQEMFYEHEMQRHEVIGMINAYWETHLKDGIECYKDGTELKLEWVYVKREED